MGKRKRSDTEAIESLLKKVKKLAKRRKRRISSSSSDENGPSPCLDESPPPAPSHIASDLESQEEIPDAGTSLAEEQQPPDENPELEPDILELFGSDPTKQKSFGDNLHKDLAIRWQHILQNGLPKEEKVDLLKQYLPAENCSFMKAPALNPEVKSALPDINTKKDSFSEQKQNQMSSCISAIGKALNLALSENTSHEIIKTLSDAGRLLCDTHYRESISRRYAVVNSLSKQKRDILKTTKIYNFLFGSNLSEFLKSSKAITTSAAELKPYYDRTNQIQRQQATQSRYPRALNARGAPRAAAAEPRVYPNPARRAPPPPPPPQPRQPAREFRAPQNLPATTSRQRPNYPPTMRRR